MTSDFDVIISGAGPAGCTAALALGSSGLKVALIEKDKFPREKVCGDAIPAYVPKVLNTISQEYVRAFEGIIEKREVDVCRFIAPNRKFIDLKFSEHGFICKRLIFDNFLFELVSRLQNVIVFTESAVREISIDRNGIFVTAGDNLKLKSRLVIGCDGANSMIRRKLAATKTNASAGSVAVRAYYKNVSENPARTLEFHFLKDLLPGYFWIFPLPDNQFNVGLGMPSKTVSERKINLRNEILRIIERDPFLSPRFSEAEMTGEIRGNFLPLCTSKIPISGDRFMLCGDAASLINPATGAGIGQAMQSGRFAGWQALKCFEKNDFSADFIQGYDKIVYNKMWKENRRYLMLREFVIKFGWRLNTLIKAGSISTSSKRIIFCPGFPEQKSVKRV
jgi:geranylgeranyl reductase family protein